MVAGAKEAVGEDAVQQHLLHALDACQQGAACGLPPEPALLAAIRTGLALSGPGAPPPPAGRSVLSQRTLRKVHEFIAANLTREISVEDIARAAFLSPYHLGRGYHRATGCSLWQYVLHCRAQRACGLIASQPGTSLAEIATLSGFESYSQFIAVFRKTRGVTPSAYRRLLEGGRN
jgi:AraC-like DNA-binding protein